jgi:hypothetical protein
MQSNIDKQILKICTKCKTEKNISEFYLYKSKYKARCNACTSKYNKIQNNKQKNQIIIDKDELKTCNYCNENKNITEFRNGYNKCKKCNAKDYISRINNNQNSFLLKLLYCSKESAKRRKGFANEFNITINDIINLAKLQNNKCYYSRITLSYQQHSDWQASLERLDPTKGYIITNIALICLEFQSVSQWTTCKYQEFIKLIFIKHSKQTINFNPIVNRKKYTKIASITINNIKYITCPHCQIKKPLDKFNKILRHGCKECTSITSKIYKRTPNGHFSRLLANMKKNSEVRKHSPPEFSLQNLYELFEAQNGLCKYSGIPLTFGSYKEINWTVSAERINNKIGYTKKNVILICYEFNTSDYTLTANNDTKIIGSSQWSEDKINIIKNTMMSQYNIKSSENI